MRTLLLIALSILFTKNADAKPSDIALCETYPAINDQLCCTKDNYLIRFGYFYCRKYVLLENTYQPNTQKVLEKIRSCLVAEVTNDHQLTCSNSEERAMGHHLKCYKHAGFCALEESEKFKIFKAAWTEVRHKSFVETMKAVFDECAR